MYQKHVDDLSAVLIKPFEHTLCLYLIVSMQSSQLWPFVFVAWFIQVNKVTIKGHYRKRRVYIESSRK